MDYEAENIKKSIVSLFEEFTESDDISEDWPRTLLKKVTETVQRVGNQGGVQQLEGEDDRSLATDNKKNTYDEKECGCGQQP